MSQAIHVSINIARIILNVCIALVSIVMVAQVAIGLRQPVNGHHDLHSVGRRLSWVTSDERQRTVIIALRKGCPFCTASMPFYRRILSIAKKHDDVNVVAVMESSVEESAQYLQSGATTFSSIRHGSLEELGVEGTPSILILDRQGIVQHSWTGLLNEHAEKKAIAEMF